MKPRLVILSGAGISAESGLKTFRDTDGLWENYRIDEVATPEAWRKNPALVQEFYNMRRKACLEAQPNAGHQICVELQQYFDVAIITQNIDNLHERAGSAHVLHLHGEITQSRSEHNPNSVFPIEGWELKMGDLCPEGSQLRPNIVWFGEAVPAMDQAIQYVQKADAMVVVGTSLQVYPAAGLIEFLPETSPIIIVDPHIPIIYVRNPVEEIADKASTGMAKARDYLMKEFKIME